MAPAVDCTVQANREGWTGIAEQSKQQEDRVSSIYCNYNVFNWKSQSRHKKPTARSPSNTPAVKPCGLFPPCTAWHLHIDWFKTNVKIPLFQWGQFRTINNQWALPQAMALAGFLQLYFRWCLQLPVLVVSVCQAPGRTGWGYFGTAPSVWLTIWLLPLTTGLGKPLVRAPVRTLSSQ